MTIGWETLDVGEQALVYSLEGAARVEVGPQRLFLWRERFERLDCYHANQNEYLIIAYHDGRMVHQPGPCAMFMNPLEHAAVKAVEALSLDANEILVVYRRDSKTNAVERYLKHGPTSYIPTANEWLHKFCWHGTDPKNKTHKVPGILKFQRLKVIPDQFYYNVDEVRTADDALMRVKLMLFYELHDIELMLNATQDPIADFINCLCADVVAFASKLTYTEFIEKSHELNELDKYPQLLERCKLIGYEVSKVVFRGYFASPTLQRMHDDAIEARTKLKIAYEKQEQQQDITDMNLSNEEQRAELEQQMEMQDLEHQQSIEKSEKEHKLTILKQQHVDKAKRLQSEEQAQLKAKVAEDEQKVEFLRELHGLGVDVTQYLLAWNPVPAKVIKVLAHEKAATLHLHQS